MLRFPRPLLFCFILSIAHQLSFAQSQPAVDSTIVVSSGVPLHIVLDERTSYTKEGKPLRGHLAQPVYVFDRIALPAGTEVLGKVAEVHPVTKRKRFAALSSGDFTPLRDAEVQF